MKTFFGVVIFTYVLMFAADYYSASKHFKQEHCEAWMKHPWYLHLMTPGPGNYCLDNVLNK